jgi:hypothetical protein
MYLPKKESEEDSTKFVSEVKCRLAHGSLTRRKYGLDHREIHREVM